METGGFDQQVGANLQRYRGAKGMSQAELAEVISTAQDRIPQQTIVKIEKGTRPLKFAEAVRISRALGIGIAELASPAEVVQRDAHYVSVLHRLSRLQSELHAYAQRLADELVGLSIVISLDRSVGNTPSPHILLSSEGFLQTNWGDQLNEYLMDSISKNPELTELRPDMVAPSYVEVLENVASRVWRRSNEDDPDA